MKWPPIRLWMEQIGTNILCLVLYRSPEETYIKVLGLNTSKAIDNGLNPFLWKSTYTNDKITLNAKAGICFSWMKESRIAYTYEGDLTNISVQSTY